MDCIEWIAVGAVIHFIQPKHVDIKRNYIISMLKEDVVKLVPVRLQKNGGRFLDEACCSDGVEETVGRCEYSPFINHYLA